MEPFRRRASDVDEIQFCTLEIPDYGIRETLRAEGGQIWFRPTGTTTSALSISGRACPLARTIPVTPMDREPYFEWAAAQLHPPERLPSRAQLLRRGEQKYHSKCEACHSLDGTDQVGPTFTGLYGSTVVLSDGSPRFVDDCFIRRYILRGHDAPGDARYPQVMPSFAGQLREKDIDALISFIEDQRASAIVRDGVP